MKRLPRRKLGKSPFKTPQLRELSDKEKLLLQKIKDISQGKVTEDSIADIPGFLSKDKKKRPLLIKSNKYREIESKGHGF